MKKTWLPIIFIGVAISGYLVFSANKEPTTESPPKDPSSRYGGTLVVGLTGDVDSFNPLFGESVTAQEVTHLVLLGLADLNEKSEFVPELATSWESSDDYLTLIYHLRKDAAWADGAPITAEDVKFTFDLLMDTTVASPRQGVTEYLKRVVVKDAHTVAFEFTKAYPDQLFDTAGEILPKHILEKADRHALRSHEFGRQPLASGPFIVKKWVSQQYLELAPNEKYFGGRPYLDRILFKIVPDNNSLLLQLQSGEVDMMMGVPPEEAGRLRETNSNINIYPVSGRVYYYIGYNEANPLFASVGVRQALTMAVDRRRIITALLYGYGRSCLGPIPSMLAWAYNEEVQELPYDPQSAGEILAKEGWRDRDGDGWIDKNGRNFEFTLQTNTGNPIRSDVAVIVQDQLKKVGIKVDIRLLEWAAMMEELRVKKFTAYIGGWSTSFNLDPTPIFHSASGELFNYVSYANPQVDRLIEMGREEMDRRKAAKIWKEMQQRLYQDQPYTFLFWIDRIVAVHARFRNVTPIPLSALYGLEKWYEMPVAEDKASD
jgi:peptide/nickel transport system substrate-binding protein